MTLLIMFLLDKAEKENSVIALWSVIFWKRFYSKASKGIMMEGRLANILNHNENLVL